MAHAQTAPVDCDVTDIALADAGRDLIEWSDASMPVLAQIRDDFSATQPLAGLTLAACLHVTTETANLARTLKAGGAKVVLCASNPLSTQDAAAAALVKHYQIPVYARRGEDNATYYRHINAVLDYSPQLTMDDGADLVSEIHKNRRDLISTIAGGTEETTTGVVRLRAMEADGQLAYPIMAVNEADTKHLFDNRYGTGQSTIDGIMRATNKLIAGSRFVICGYGWCGRGLAARAAGMGASVIVTEVNPTRALEALMDGYQVMSMARAAAEGDFFVTVTSNKNVIDGPDFARMKDGAILANAGHFDAEINIPVLTEMASSVRTLRPLLDEYRMADGNRIRLLAGGRLVNLAAAEGHPPGVMDMSFANQALGAQFMWERVGQLEPRVYGVPADIDSSIARLKLASMGVEIDSMTAAQTRYASSWEEGT